VGGWEHQWGDWKKADKKKSNGVIKRRGVRTVYALVRSRGVVEMNSTLVGLGREGNTGTRPARKRKGERKGTAKLLGKLDAARNDEGNLSVSCDLRAG